MSTILVAEDDKHVAKALEVRLQREGYEVLVARNGREAFEMAAAERPDLLLLDIAMPRGSGFSVLRELQDSDDWWEPPVIFMTASGRPSLKAEALDLGRTAFIRKPYDPYELMNEIRRALFTARRQRSA